MILMIATLMSLVENPNSQTLMAFFLTLLPELANENIDFDSHFSEQQKKFVRIDLFFTFTIKLKQIFFKKKIIDRRCKKMF